MDAAVSVKAAPRRSEQAARVIATALGALWLGVFPLLGVLWLSQWPPQIPLSFGSMTRSKWELMLLLVFLGATVSPALLVLGRRRFNWRHPGLWLLLGYFSWVALSACFGSAADLLDQHGAPVVWVGAGRFEGLCTQLCYMGILITMSLCRPYFKPVAIAAALGALVMSGVVAGQYMGVNVLGLYPGTRSIYTNYEFQGTLGNIDMVAGYLALMAPLLLGSWVVQGQWPGLITVPAGCCCVLLMLLIDVQSGLLALLFGMALLLALMLRCPNTRSRGLVVLALVLLCFSLRQLIGLPWIDGLQAPWHCPQRADAVLPLLSGGEPVIFPWQPSLKKLLPALLGLLLMVPAILLRRRPGGAMPLWLILTLGGALATLAVIAVWLLPIPQRMGGLWELHEILGGRMQDQFGSERYGIWRHTLLIAREHLLFGTGPDTFLQVMKDHLRSVGAQFMQTFDNPHNILLAVLVQNGLPALALLLAGLAAVVIRAGKRPLCLALAAGLLCYLAQCMFCFSLCIVTPMFWSMAGMCISLSVQETGASAPKSSIDR